MTETRSEILEIQKANFKVVMNTGGRLSYETKTWIAARNYQARKVLIGGLGGLGVGYQWYDEQEVHAEMPGYLDAPESDSSAKGERERLFYENLSNEARRLEARRQKLHWLGEKLLA